MFAARERDNELRTLKEKQDIILKIQKYEKELGAAPKKREEASQKLEKL